MAGTEELEVKLKINDEEVLLSMPVDETDHLFKITNDNEYTIHYVTELINNGFISLQGPLRTIKRVEDDGREILIYGQDENNEDYDISPNVNLSGWTDYETIKLLDLYEQYLPFVGPFKKFKTKKLMWNKIAEILNSTFNSNRTGIQVENRYKTVLKRKKNAVDNNKTSGALRMEVPFETELNKIASIDDSIEPEVTGSANGIKIFKRKVLHEYANSSRSSASSDQSPTSSHDKPTPRRKVKTIQETLMEIHEKKEEAKERRHQEKMEVLKKLLSKDSNNSTG